MKLHYVDCCEGSYLQDHHNRDGEQMLIVNDPNDCSPDDIKKALIVDLGMIDVPESWRGEEQTFYALGEEVIEEFFDENPEFSFAGPFSDECCGYFYLSWGC